MTRDVLAAPDDAIGERDARPAAGKLAHLEARAALAARVEPAAFASRREEHVIVAALDHFAEVGVELDHGTAPLELRRAKVLEPMLGTLHAMEQALRAVRERHDPVFDPCKYLAGLRTGRGPCMICGESLRYPYLEWRAETENGKDIVICGRCCQKIKKGFMASDLGGSGKGPILRHLPDPRYYFNVHTRSCAA